MCIWQNENHRTGKRFAQNHVFELAYYIVFMWKEKQGEREWKRDRLKEKGSDLLNTHLPTLHIDKLSATFEYIQRVKCVTLIPFNFRNDSEDNSEWKWMKNWLCEYRSSSSSSVLRKTVHTFRFMAGIKGRRNIYACAHWCWRYGNPFNVFFFFCSFQYHLDCFLFNEISKIISKQNAKTPNDNEWFAKMAGTLPKAIIYYLKVANTRERMLLRQQRVSHKLSSFIFSTIW